MSRGMDGWCADWACVTPAPKTISVQHICKDHDEDTVNLEQNDILANTVERRSTVPVQEDFEDMNSASSDSLSPDLGEAWRSVFVPVNISEEEGSATSSTFSTEVSFEYHDYNVWNSMLVALCHFEIGAVLVAHLDDVAMGRIALACHFSLDLLCHKNILFASCQRSRLCETLAASALPTCCNCANRRYLTCSRK